MKVKKMETFQNKTPLLDCNWSRLNVLSTKICQPIQMLRVLPSQKLALWGHKNGIPSMEVKILRTFWIKFRSNSCQWNNLNAKGIEIPMLHPLTWLVI